MKEADNPPTARELAARANGSDPWACPRCGCRDWRVANTYDVAGDSKKRRRICRHCKQGLLPTEEVPVPKGFRVLVVPDEERGAA